jgi:hypothetical protein
MLKAHNTKTAVVIDGFRRYQALRERSVKEGIKFEELMLVEEGVKGAKKGKRKFKEAEFEMKIKGEDGVI